MLNLNTAKAPPEDSNLIYACSHSFDVFFWQSSPVTNPFFPIFHNVLSIPKIYPRLSSHSLFLSYQHLKALSLSLHTFVKLTIALFLSHLLLSFPITLTWLFSLGEGEEEVKISLLQRKRNQLAGYCKLVIYGVLDLTAATDVFKHYSKVQPDLMSSLEILIGLGAQEMVWNWTN